MYYTSSSQVFKIIDENNYWIGKKMFLLNIIINTTIRIRKSLKINIKRINILLLNIHIKVNKIFY